MKLNLILYAIGAACIVGLLVVVKTWHTKATVELPKARAALEQANASIEALQQARERDESIAKALASLREQQAAGIRAFDETLRTSKVTKEIRYVDKQGNEAVCVQRDPVVYRSLYNEALSSTPSAADLLRDVPR